MKTDKEIEEIAESRYFNANLKSLKKSHFIKGTKWYRDSFSEEIENLRNDIEKCTESLDLVKDSDIIQMYGSIIGRLNLILNQ